MKRTMCYPNPGNESFSMLVWNDDGTVSKFAVDYETRDSTPVDLSERDKRIIEIGDIRVKIMVDHL